MAATATYNQDFPAGTNRPGMQLLEVTIDGDGIATTATAVFPKPFRNAPRIVSAIRLSPTGGANPLTRLTRFSSITPTQFIAVFNAAPAGSEVWKVFVLGELAPS